MGHRATTDGASVATWDRRPALSAGSVPFTHPPHVAVSPQHGVAVQPVGGNFASVLYPTDYLEYTGTCAGPRQRGRAATLPTTSWLVLTCVCCCAPVLQATARTTRTACTVCSPWLTQLQPSNSWCVCVYAWSCATARAPPQCAAVAPGPARDVGLWACDCASVEQVQRYFALPNMSLAEVRVGGQGSGLAPPMFTSTRSVPAAAAHTAVVSILRTSHPRLCTVRGHAAQVCGPRQPGRATYLGASAVSAL